MGIDDTSGASLIEIGHLRTGDDEEFTHDQVGLVISNFSLDRGEEFASGGLDLDALGMSDHKTGSNFREREILNDIAASEMNILVCERVLSNIADSISKLMEKIQGSSASKTSKLNSGVSRESTLCVSANTANVILTSNEMNPFAKLSLESLSCKITNNPSPGKPKLDLSAGDVLLLNLLVPEEQLFPDFVRGIESCRS